MRSLIAIALVAGCQSMSGGHAGTATATGNSPPQSEPNPGTTPTVPTAGDVPRSETHVGTVVLDSDPSSAGSGSYVYPTFSDVTPETGCTQTVVGDCTVVVCSASAAPPPTLPQLYSAGAITVTGGLYGVNTLPAADGSYAELDSANPLWSGGEPLTVAASGDVVPAFNLTLRAPRPLVVRTPSSSSSIAIDRTQDLAIRWDPSTDGVDITIGADGSGDTSGYVLCSVPSEPGGYTLPSSLLAQLPPGPGAVIVESVGQQVRAPGTWTIYAEARAVALDDAGGAFSKLATLQ